jgi:hypothetical protein
MASMFVSSIASIAAGGSVLGPAFFLGLLDGARQPARRRRHRRARQR